MKDLLLLLFLLLSLMVFQSSHGRHYYNQQPPNLPKTLQLDDQNQNDKLASAAVPALLTGLLALAFSSLLTGSLQINATTTAKESDSFPLLWALPIEYEGQARNDQRKLRKKSVRRRVPKARSALPLLASSSTG